MLLPWTLSTHLPLSFLFCLALLFSRWISGYEFHLLEHQMLKPPDITMQMCNKTILATASCRSAAQFLILKKCRRNILQCLCIYILMGDRSGARAIFLIIWNWFPSKVLWILLTFCLSAAWSFKCNFWAYIIFQHI